MAKGENTKEEILKRAFALASLHGLGGLTIGSLAKEVGMSKSGLFAHFRSKENLQLDVLQWAREHFVDAVMRPVVQEERGLPRIRALFESWMAWHREVSGPGGCVFISSASEFDDHPGKVQELLRGLQLGVLDSIARMVGGAVEKGHFRRDANAEQFSYELYSLMMGYHHFHRLLQDKESDERLRVGFERLIEAHVAGGEER